MFRAIAVNLKSTLCRVSPHGTGISRSMLVTRVGSSAIKSVSTCTTATSSSLLSKVNQLNRCTYCTTSVRSMSAKVQADKDLSSFLDSEITAESAQAGAPVSKIPGFEIETNGSLITLTRKHDNETIRVKFNVNGTVDQDGPDDEAMMEQAAKTNDPNALGDMKSKPELVVEVSKPTGKILAFNLRLYGDSELPADQPEADKFEIEGFTLLKTEDVDEDGDWADNLYVGDGGIIDGQMYDLLMNFLESRGITNEFVDTVVDYSTSYEHGKYISLLKEMKSFLEGK